MRKLRVLSLFAGIGGFDLGLERTGGFETVAFCEIEPFCQRVLAKHWPHVPCYHDVRELTSERLRADGISVDVICGGFPCQPFSSAARGRNTGKASDRYLWPEMLRLIAELQPAWVIGENVTHIDSVALEQVVSDLEACGYEVQTIEVPACAVGHDHRRSRLWILGHADRNGEPGLPFDAEVAGLSWSGPDAGSDRAPYGLPGTLDGGLNACCEAGPGREDLPALRRPVDTQAVLDRAARGFRPVRGPDVLRHGMPAAGTDQAGIDQPPNDVFALTEVPEASVRALRRDNPAARTPSGRGQDQQRAGELGDIVRHLPQPTARRTDRLAALGNAVVPQIPELIGHAILASLNNPLGEQSQRHSPFNSFVTVHGGD